MAHHAPQGVDFLHQVALGQPAHRRVAGHLGHGVQVEVEEQYLQPHPGRRQRAFAPGVAGADDYQIIFFRIKGHGGNF